MQERARHVSPIKAVENMRNMGGGGGGFPGVTLKDQAKTSTIISQCVLCECHLVTRIASSRCGCMLRIIFY